MTSMRPLNQEEKARLEAGLAPWKSMSFACGGWLQFYMFGVAKAMQITKMDKGAKYAGCSAGALAAVGLTIGGDFDGAIKFCVDECVPRAYGESYGLFQLSDYVKKCIERLIIPKYFEIPPGDLQIAVTRLPFFVAERVTHHKSKEDLMLSLLASCAAFPAASLIRRNNAWYIDGGISDFQPLIDADTITVSPFYFSDCDIKPSRYVPLWWTFMPPHSKDTIEWLYKLGFEDGVRYVKSRGIPLQSMEEYESMFSRDHPYDAPKRVSMHRFLGYDVHELTHEYVAFAFDLVLLAWLVLVWKPLALLLIYAELVVRAGVLFFVTLVMQVSLKLPATRINVERIMQRCLAFLLVLGYPRPSNEKITQSASIYRCYVCKQLWDCLACIASLSLLLRFISGGPSNVELRKHDRLAKLSVLYRVFRHII